MTFGQRIRFFRNRVKKSQKDVENETAIPQTTLSGWETGISEPRASELQKLAAALGVSIADLMDDSQPADDPATTDPGPAA